VKEDLSKMYSKMHETKLKKELRQDKNVRIINLSNIKHGNLDRMINESDKLNRSLEK
jgi:hypothetical protein